MPAVTEPPSAPAAPASLEARLLAWLRDAIGLEEGRRVARVDAGVVLVSKFEPGFAPQLHELLDELPELFDPDEVERAYRRCAAESAPAEPRVAVWGSALHSLLATLGAQRGIDDGRRALVHVGIDSVQAVLDSVLWSRPTAGDDYAPLSGERAAYRDATRQLDPGRELFTRYYGTFEGRRVENHCPGAAFARVMLAHAWSVCTGTPPPD